MPSFLARENSHHSPAAALWLTNGCVQVILIVTLFARSTYLGLILLATSLILLPYLWSAAYQVLLAVRGETYADGRGRTRDLVIGGIALIYAIWLVYAGGVEYLLTGAVAYFLGTALYVWGRRESNLRVFTAVEWVIFAAVVLAAGVGVYGILTGDITVF